MAVPVQPIVSTPAISILTPVVTTISPSVSTAPTASTPAISIITSAVETISPSVSTVPTVSTPAISIITPAVTTISPSVSTVPTASTPAISILTSAVATTQSKPINNLATIELGLHRENLFAAEFGCPCLDTAELGSKHQCPEAIPSGHYNSIKGFVKLFRNLSITHEECSCAEPVCEHGGRRLRTELSSSEPLEPHQTNPTSFSVDRNCNSSENSCALDTDCPPVHIPLVQSTPCRTETLTKPLISPAVPSVLISTSDRKIFPKLCTISNFSKENRLCLESGGLPSKTTVVSSGSPISTWHQPQKWIIKRESRSTNLHDTGYGEKNNVWTQSTMKRQTAFDNQTPEHKPDLDVSYKEDFSHQLERGNLGNTTSSKGNLEIQTSFDEKETRTSHFKSNFTNSKIKKRKSKSNFRNISGALSEDGLLRNFQNSCSNIPYDEFRENRYLGNKLVSKEMHRNLRISRELMYRKSQRSQEVKRSKEVRRLSSSTASGSSQETCDLSLCPVSQDETDIVNLLSRTIFKCINIASPLNSTEGIHKASELTEESPPKKNLPSSASSSSSLSETGVSSKQSPNIIREVGLKMAQHHDIILAKQIPHSQHSAGTVYKHKDSLRDLEADINIPEVNNGCTGNQKAQFKTRHQEINTTDKIRCQEMLDYFWSYQGMGRQVLGMRALPFSHQSALWEQEETPLTEIIDSNVHKDQEHKLIFSKFDCLPPIPIRKQTDVLSNNTFNSFPNKTSSFQKLENRGLHERQTYFTERDGKKLTIETSSPFCQERSEMSEACNPEHQKTTGGNKLCLVVKLPLQQKNEEEE
ncbi:hypothetical protein ElyMa_006153900 [Elysia marginata]|uniref:Uncharacterized protein n=1 Tax=Elysia marginata TaxID=1093978 RepID=A0AAV4GYX1_9GAST|nr:hypothetical protein ElyMa_006153900 [Elysia marginata]